MTTVQNCSRCNGNHEVEFQELRHPTDSFQTHWAPCPVTGEPILMRYIESSETQQVLDGSSALIVDPYITIKFQLGPVKEFGVNGTTIERIIDLLIARLDGFQRGPFACEYNASAIESLKGAKWMLEARTAERKTRGVEGKNEA